MATRTLNIRILGDASDANRAFDSVGQSAGEMDRSLAGFIRTNKAAIAATGVASGFAALSLTNAASDYEEALNKVNVVFGDNADLITDWAEGSADRIGLPEQAALEAAGTFGNLFTSLGTGIEPAAEMSSSLVDLASDLASFNNIGTEDALTALRSGIVGEIEPMRRLGVAINAADVEARALAMGLADTADALTEGDKAAARYALIMEQTSNAQGDFARTSDSFANQQRILKARFEELQVEIGQKLLPVMEKIAPVLIGAMDAIVPVIEGFAFAFDLYFVKPIEAVQAAVRFFRDDFPGYFTSARDTVTGFGSDVMAGMLSGVTTGFAAVQTWFVELPGVVAGFFADASAWLYDGGRHVVGGVFNGIVVAWVGIKDWFENLPGVIAEFFVDAVTWLLDAGKDVARGFWNGFADILNQARWTIDIPGINIPGPIPDIPGFSMTIDPFPHVPNLAEGGIVKATPGGVLARIGEGGQDEAVVPLGRNGRHAGLGNTYHVTINVNGGNPDEVRRTLEDFFDRRGAYRFQAA